tara:strand:+ start:1506 stop:1625 length:120 start_codon:yes stop_codon:yes gene_type:complete
MTDLFITPEEEIDIPDSDFDTDETLAYILGRISGEIIED